MSTGDARKRLHRDILQQRREKAIAYGRRTQERLRSSGIQIFSGSARLTGPHTVSVSDYDNPNSNLELTADFLVLCTGARPRHLPRCRVDGRVVHDYKTIEEVDPSSLPTSIVVLGGGTIACETACHMAYFGVKTTLLTPLEPLRNLDPLLADAIINHLREQCAVEIQTGCELQCVSSDGCRARVELKGTAATVEAEGLVVAMGSVPNTEWLGFEAVPLRLDGQGAVEVDEDMRSSVPHIFACGDCCSRGGLLNLAKRQGLCAVAALHRDRSRVLSVPPAAAPAVLWTVPEVATVGARGGRAGSFDIVTRYVECDRVLEGADEAYFLKLVYEMQTMPSRVFVRGVHIFGPHAEKLISRGAELLDRTLDEALSMSMPAAATLEELYTMNLQAAAKRTIDLRAQQPYGGYCVTM